MLPVLGGALIRFYYGYQHVAHFLVTIAQGIHLFPFRTEKLSPAAPMVLPNRWESRSSPSPCEGLPSSSPAAGRWWGFFVEGLRFLGDMS